MKKILLILLSFLLSLNCYGGVDFNGDADLISAPNCGDYMEHSFFAISMWLIPDFNSNDNTNRTIFSNHDDSGAEWQTIKASDNKIYCGTKREGTWRRATATHGTDYSWVAGDLVHLLWTSDSVANVIAIYINGVNVGTNYTNEFSNIYPNQVEEAYITNGSFDGVVTEVCVFSDAAAGEANRVPTQTEIDLLAKSKIKRIGLQIVNMRMYYPLDDYSSGTGINGKTYLDMSGNGNTGTGVDADADSTNVGEEVLSYPK